MALNGSGIGGEVGLGWAVGGAARAEGVRAEPGVVEGEDEAGLALGLGGFSTGEEDEDEGEGENGRLPRAYVGYAA